MIRSTPNFTKAMRGYDIEEVDEYVDALRESEDEQASALAAAEATNQALTGEVERLRARITELEGCIRAETPRSIAALGERLTLLLEEAEAGAAEAMRVARDEADSLVSAARASSEEERLLSAARTADAEQRATARLSAAEEMARTTEATARARAEEIVAEAESRALARRHEIEAWVERVRTHIETEETRAAEEFARLRALRNGELANLDRRREAMLTSLIEMADALRGTVTAARDTTDAAAAATGGTVATAPPADPEDDDPTVSLALPSAGEALEVASVSTSPADPAAAASVGSVASVASVASVGPAGSAASAASAASAGSAGGADEALDVTDGPAGTVDAAPAGDAGIRTVADGRLGGTGARSNAGGFYDHLRD